MTNDKKVVKVQRFFTDRDRYIGGALRKGGNTEGFMLSVSEIPKKLPLGMKMLNKLTPKQEAAKANKAKKAKKVNKQIEVEKATAGIGASANNIDFMEDKTDEGIDDTTDDESDYTNTPNLKKGDVKTV